MEGEAMKQVTTCCKKTHDFFERYPAESNAAVAGLSTLAWYALPDVTGSSVTRFFAKSGIVAAVGYYAAHGPEAARMWQESKEDTKHLFEDTSLAQLPVAAQIALCAGVIGAGIYVNSLTERWLLHRGERKERQGKKLPHVKQAVVLAALAGAATYASAKARQTLGTQA